MRVAVVLLAVLAVSAASPQFFFNRGGSATGSANSGTAFGSSPGGTISQTFANAGGSASNGGSSFNRASANQFNAQTPFGNFNNANSQATSNQFGGGRRRPFFGGRRRFFRG